MTVFLLYKVTHIEANGEQIVMRELVRVFEDRTQAQQYTEDFGLEGEYEVDSEEVY